MEKQYCVLKVCVCILAFVIRHANRISSAPYYIVICGLSRSTMFFPHRLTLSKIFEKKKITGKTCFNFLHNFSWKISHSKKNSERYCHTYENGFMSNTKFFNIISQTTIFSEKLQNIKCVFWFSLQLLFHTFLILRITQRDIVINVKSLRVKYPLFLSDFNETWIFWADFRKINKYQILSKSVKCEPSYPIRTDGWTDGHDKTNRPFSQLCERTSNTAFIAANHT